jgi:hypothetical protein
MPTAFRSIFLAVSINPPIGWQVFHPAGMKKKKHIGLNIYKKMNKKNK